MHDVLQVAAQHYAYMTCRRLRTHTEIYQKRQDILHITFWC